jgi:hypothetical protein
LVDSRPDSAILGSVGGRPVNAVESARWVESELRRAVAARYNLVSDASHALTLQPRLHKLYVSSLDITKTAVVVLELRVIHADGRSTGRYFRGQYSSMNWGSTEGEILEAVRAAVRNCMAQVKAGIP